MSTQDLPRGGHAGSELVVRANRASELELARTALDEAIAAADELTTGGAGTDVVVARSNDPVEVKRQLAATEQRLHEAQAAVRTATARWEAAIKDELARVQRVLAPIQRAVNQLQAGIVSVNLYLGRAEELHQLRDGESAPADTPIAIRQMLLFMGEEMAAADPEGGFSPVTDIELFDKWLLADPSHLDQVLPEVKGVVALRPRRKAPARDRWTTEEAQLNRRTYWLIRNGERLFRVVTELELDDRVFPYEREREQLFLRETADGRAEPLLPGSHAWERAQEHAEERDQRYMRAALVVEGLLHRTVIFHPLPDAGVSFLDPRDVRDGRVRFITDAENTLGTGEQTFEAWRAELAERLQPGMRIVLGPGIEQHNWDDRSGRNARLTPPAARKPGVGGIYTVTKRGYGRDRWADRQGTQLTFLYHEGERWVTGASGRAELREPTKRASCIVFGHDKFVLPLDLVTVDELRRFLHRRTERHHYEEMFPIIKTAIAALEREAAAEEPFRKMLAGVLASENGVSVEDAAAAVDDLVAWWKTKTKGHRPLLLAAALPTETEDGQPVAVQVDPEEEAQRSAKAVRMIVAEHAGRLRDERRPVDQRVLQQLRDLHPVGRLVIARPRGRGYLVVVAAEQDKNVYVHEHEYTSDGECKDTGEWVIPRHSEARAWRVIEESDRWSAWDFRAHEAQHLRGPERDELREQAIRKFEATVGAVVLGAHRRDGSVRIWTLAQPAKLNSSRPLTQEPQCPRIGSIEGRWRRVDGAVEWYWNTRGDESMTRHMTALPWDELEWRSTFDRQADVARRTQYEIVHEDDGARLVVNYELTAFRAAWDRYKELEERAARLTQSVADQWLRARWTAVREQFDEDFGQPDRWPTHRKMIEPNMHVPREWTLRRHRGSVSSGIVLYDAIAHLVEVGEDPAGRTVGDIAREATERWGALWASEDRWWRGESKPVEVPAALLEFVVSEYVFEHDGTHGAADYQ